MRARIMCVFESRIWPGPTAWPGETSSSPVERIATRGGNATSTCACPSAASNAMVPGPITSPERASVSPTGKSSPAGRTFSPTATGARMRTVAASGDETASVCSIATTASAPAGSGAPVMIRIASPRATACVATPPAASVSLTASVTDAPAEAEATSAARTANPSIAELSKRGNGSCATRSARSVRSSASSSAIVSAGMIAIAARARIAERASSNVTKRRALAVPVATLASALFPQGDLADHHAAVDRFQHVVDGEGGHGDGGQRLHLDAGPPGARDARLDGHARAERIEHECEIDAVERKRVRERDQLRGALGGADAGELGDGEHVALLGEVVAHDGERLCVHEHAAARERLAHGRVLGADVHHARLATRVDVGRAHLGSAARIRLGAGLLGGCHRLDTRRANS